MVFSSLSFLFCFFPAFLLVYYLTPSRPAGARNAVLLVGSCVFYIIGLDGQWAYFALLAASVLVNYGLGLAITRDKPRAKLWLIVGLCYNFLWLFLFKYLNFLLTGVNGVLGWVSGGKAAVPLLGWALLGRALRTGRIPLVAEQLIKVLKVIRHGSVSLSTWNSSLPPTRRRNPPAPRGIR